MNKRRKVPRRRLLKDDKIAFRDNPPICAACGGVLILLTEVPEHPRPNKQGHPRVLYFRCERCAQTQIVED